MAAPSINLAADSYSAQIEAVRPKLQEYFETSDTVAARIKKSGEAQKISDRLYRIPIIFYKGGIDSKFDADGGDMGSGTGPKVSNVTAGYFYNRHTVEISKRAQDTTASPEQSVVNVFAYSLKNAIREAQVIDDIIFHTDGSGILTNRASATSTWTGSKTTYTFAGTTDRDGVSKLRPGMAVQSFDYDGSALNTEAPDPLVIDHIDWTNKVVYLDGIVTSPVGSATGDILVYPGVSATAQSYQSGWPLTGDSFRHGLKYANDVTTSNYFLGKLKSDNTELLCNYVNAASGGISFAHGQQFLDQIVNRRDESVYRGLWGLAHMAQRAAVFNIGVAISNWFRGKSDKMIDVQPSNNQYSSEFDFCGIPCTVDKRQSKDRVDFIVPKLWGRAYLHDLRFEEWGGRTVFESRASTGNIKAATVFHLTAAFDYFTVDPGSGGYVGSLAVPSGY